MDQLDESKIIGWFVKTSLLIANVEKTKIMRGLLLLSVTFFPFLNTTAQQPKYEVTGVIKGIGNTKVLLGNKPTGYSSAFKIEYFDSCISRNDTFYFTGHVDNPEFYSIEVENIWGWKPFILENTKIFIKGNKDSIYRAKVDGSSETDAYIKFKFQNATFWRKNNFLVKKLDSLRGLKISDSSLMKILSDSLKIITRQRLAYLFDFIEINPDKFISLYELNGISSHIPKDSLIKYFLALSPRLKNTPRGKQLSYKIFKKEYITKKGGTVPDFKIVNEKGNIFSFHEFRGKYILLDFWASWCGPCIDEFPSLDSLYNKYKSAGFEILGISLDTDKANWLKAEKQHHIPWKTFCDLQGNETKAYRLLGRNTIPLLILIDKGGKIIAYNPTVEQLGEELRKIFHY